MEEKTVATLPHKLHIDNRSKITLTGITEVVSFDDKQVILDTVQGMLSISGEGLKVDRLTIDNGEAGIEGTVYKMEYADKREVSAGSIFSRLFR